MPEVWLPVAEFEGFYEVSDLGQVRSVARRVLVAPSWRSAGYWRPVRQRILRPILSSNGYLTVALWREHAVRIGAVHVLVLEAFVGKRPDGHYGCHRDGRPRNNVVGNLYWGTPTENAADKREHGTHLQGSAIPWARLTESDVARIRSLRGVAKQADIAAAYGIQPTQVSRIMSGWQWRHVPQALGMS